MNHKIKAILMLCLLVVTLAFVAGCAPEESPYAVNDGENFSVSVKYDANGGIFTTNTSVIVDSYNISGMKTDDNGNAQIALLPPDSSYRGNDAFTAINNGYFLAGWYSERTERTDSSGNTQYTYSGKWDFEKDTLAVDPTGTYTAAEPVMTLYAAWVPLFEIEFYALDSGEYLDSLTFNPNSDGEVLLPIWDTQTGAIEMYDFPEQSGKTFRAAYYDAEGKQAVTTEAVTHPGVVDYESGTAADAAMKLYVDYMEGEWYRIYNVEQFLDNASVGGSYVLHADLDFTDEIWPSSLMYGNFSGTIEGNGHTISNVRVTQTNNSKVNAGLFGQLTENASISGVTFDNVTFTIQSGSRVVGACYGLLAGTVSAEAALSDVTVANSRLQIDSGCYFSTDEYSIGLLCGMGSTGMDPSGITCTAVGDNPEKVAITVSGNAVEVEFIQ